MDAFDFVQKSELKSTPTYAQHPDIALAVIESAEYKQGPFGKTPDAEMFDLVFRLITTASQNKAKSADNAGDIIRYKAVLPHTTFNERTNEVKASVFKRLCESSESTDYASYKTNRKKLCSDLTGKQVKIVIVLEEAFIVDKVTTEPLLKNFTKVTIVEHPNNTINKSMNDIQKIIPLNPKKRLKYDKAKSYWDKLHGQQEPKDDVLEQKSDDPWDKIM
tara:strand:+ start:6694 stop:7350 length:657 start_codon:yes stop_codon:yes gene_type:complete